jgi:hypothetical protein
VVGAGHGDPLQLSGGPVIGLGGRRYASVVPATTIPLTNPIAWVSTVVGIVVCVSRARLFRSKSGRDPWGVPLWGWALIGFFLGLVAAIGVLIATRRSALAAAEAKAGAAAPVGAWPPVVNGSVDLTAAGWYPVRGDPLEQTYWDGTRWTAHIRWDGLAWVDADRPQPAVPAVPKVEAPPPSSALARFFMK